MRFMTINGCDTINTLKGVAVSLWVSGCPHKCEGCFNTETWDSGSGMIFNRKVENQLLDKIGSEYVAGFSVLGGEPFAPDNIFKVLEIIDKVKVLFPEKRVMVWTGYRLQDINKDYDLSNIDYIIDGRYVDKLNDKKLKLRGSSNQTVWKNTGDEWMPLTDKEIEEEMK